MQSYEPFSFMYFASKQNRLCSFTYFWGYYDSHGSIIVFFEIFCLVLFSSEIENYETFLHSTKLLLKFDNERYEDVYGHA